MLRQDIPTTKSDEVTPCGTRERSVWKGTPLSTTPSVYLNFHLENPRSFVVVSEHTEVVRQPLSTIREGDDIAAKGDLQPTRKTLVTSTILQEKLSWYMDTVEIHLVSPISQASASFFSACSAPFVNFRLRQPTLSQGSRS